ncbi:hypothetical protein L195_g061256, partial [Trifolium pratense]
KKKLSEDYYYEEYENERLSGEASKAEALNLEEEGDRRDSRVLAEDEAIWKDFRAQFDAISCFSVVRIGTKERSHPMKKYGSF